jgi:hypothetical protein
MTTLKKVGALLLGILTLLLLIGVVAEPRDDLAAGLGSVAVFGAATYFLWRSAQRGVAADRAALQAEEQRRQAALQQRVIDLAIERGGVLTVTDVVADLDFSIPSAEGVLQSLDDGVRVTSNVTEQGVIVYEFREVMHRQARLGAPRPGTQG